jgi:hypothetical protein
MKKREISFFLSRGKAICIITRRYILCSPSIWYFIVHYCSHFLLVFSYKVTIRISMSLENECFFKNKEFRSDTLISLHELRHERFTSTVFPGARSCIEIMLLRSDLFYQPVLRLRRIYVCTKHKDDLLKEFRRSKYRNCFVCIPCFGKATASIAVQNIAAPVALTLYEQFQFSHSYGKPICRRCRSDIMKQIHSVRYTLSI